jgi:hypothetical protein
MIDRDVGLAAAAATCCGAVLVGLVVIAALGARSWTPVVVGTGLVAVGVGAGLVVARLVMRTGSTGSGKRL